MNDELNPCRKCGAEDSTEFSPLYYGRNGLNIWVMTCSRCGDFFPEVVADDLPRSNVLEILTTRWNKHNPQRLEPTLDYERFLAREIKFLAFLQTESLGEAGKIIGCTGNAVRVMVHKTLVSMGRFLQRVGEPVPEEIGDLREIRKNPGRYLEIFERMKKSRYGIKKPVREPEAIKPNKVEIALKVLQKLRQ